MEKVFVYQGGLGFMGRLLTWLVGGIWLIVTPLVLFSGMKGLPAEKTGMVLILTLGCLGFILFGRWMANAHSGEIVLTHTGIVQRKGGKDRFLAYQEILSTSHRKAIRYCVAGVLLLLILYTRSRAVLAAGDEAICPAFFDNAGGRLLISERFCPQDLSEHMYAIFADNQASPVHFIKKQPASSGNTGRQTAANFDNYPGYVFAVDKQGLPEKSCLVVSEAFFNSLEFIAYESTEEGLTEAETALIETVCERKVVDAWGIVRLATGQKLILIRFEALGDEQLASLVLLDCGHQPVFRHYYGKGKDNSVWRVDDGGEISPRQFNILYIAREQNLTEIAYEFIGPEGIQIVVARENGGEFISLTEGSRYTSPI